jgi:hypothetical protein
VKILKDNGGSMMAQDVFKDPVPELRGDIPSQVVDTHAGHVRERSTLYSQIVEIEQMIDVELDPHSDLYKKLRALLSALQETLVKP